MTQEQLSMAIGKSTDRELRLAMLKSNFTLSKEARKIIFDNLK